LGYLSFQIIFFLLLAALLGFMIGWLLRGSRFQSELQDLDGRWRTKLGEVEGERDRFVAELTQSNDAKAKLDAEVKRLAETHDSNVKQLKRDHQTKLAAYADAEKATADLQSHLAARNDELAQARAELAKASEAGGEASRLGQELAAARERAADLEGALDEARAANASCKSEVDHLSAEIAELQRAGGGSTASSGGALGLIGDAGSGGSAGLRSVSGGGNGEGAMSGGAAATGPGVSSSPGGSGPTYTQRAASPSYLADAAGQDFGSSGSDAGGSGADDTGDEEEGVQPAALPEARGGQADDLKRISGVGPKLEKTLNGLGIFHFSQIAEFTPDNVTWVDRHLRFKGRIARENWIGQAKILASGGETDFSRRQ
jgi:predicted flap endonuclease-1-like 5' DNA nuclease/predicted  nucleic acid-binding Zn-ribbon protein